MHLQVAYFINGVPQFPKISFILPPYKMAKLGKYLSVFATFFCDSQTVGDIRYTWCSGFIDDLIVFCVFSTLAHLYGRHCVEVLGDCSCSLFG
jgi:hypothetical protein